MRLTEAGGTPTADLQAWLAADPDNRAAWQALENVWNGVERVAAEPQMIAARRDALQRAQKAGARRWTSPGASRRAMAAGLAACAFLALGAASWMSLRPDVYATRVGERRTVTLDDGSQVALDAASRLEVRYGRAARELRLAAGQARFDVAHDVTRPFRVRAGDRTVVATGTRFNVEVLDGRVVVTLLEGGVSVSGGAAAAGPAVRLRPGQRLAASTAAGAPAATVDVVAPDKAVAWETGSLIFDDEPLTVVAERVSRYTDRRLVVADAGAAALRVSGVFSAGDLETFLDTLTSYLPVEATAGPQGVIALRSRG